ncbi:ABC transporter permease [Desulfitobacterium hafniense]|uniref:ABC transmembrane type-1 domain-containing protein n=5 Tax=root TaxID=1 RepID=Q24WD9_DESHY|nr:ABC transporter permease [Desulfitobacterium hafniense]ACL21042.1 binding-protein-dependent transport systems inner membrane component [Desulfitobacterium hafniense DCB-2]EHL07011.1 ABC transporter, permease protein [Desulfitobacterium hafniense DP7]KTE91310.1 peptide ABC transporter permease [Desulfitobacterium hafniense]MEA5021814.1 ABC transporter permease [Desulfitobacterium hafniense]CDX01933.1 Oligopeptide transport system permease protein OppC [Desulfitobacterium hafniense]
MTEKNPLSLQLKVEDFLPATDAEKQSLTQMRPGVSFWKDAMRRLRKNKVAMISLTVILVVMFFSFIVPSFYPYKYEQQIKGSEYLKPMTYSTQEQLRIDAGEKVFPHILGTDNLGRDYAVRVMVGSRISLMVGLIASAIILVIGSTYGAVSGFFGGWVDLMMMRIVDIIYTVPDILLIVLISFAIRDPLGILATKPGFGWIQTVGPNLISIFLVFALLYWVGMARIVRSQVLALKQNEYVTAARALGAGTGRIIRKHLLTNCIGTLIVTTTLQIPSSIFTESFLSFLGLGVAVPLPSLGSLASDALNGLNSYPYLLMAPALLISLIILSFNLLGDGLRDAFDPKMKS